MIAHYKILTDQYNLIEPLKELVMDGSTDDVLTPQHRHILTHADSIREQYKQTPVHLNRLCSKSSVAREKKKTSSMGLGMVADLFIDKHKFEGINVKAKVPMLFEKLNASFSQPNVFIDFFNTL